ncbi:MAG: nucleotidyltransferase domain-containing protein [Deltaproteobacteria bacterium]|nr:nucleotidyltransferase domain-containing protein [Deltaproteobacteria bacterium]
MQNHQLPTTAHPAASKTLEEVRRIVLDEVGGGRARVYLFGSWARGEATSLSDIDVAIEPHMALPQGALARLRERLEESHIPYRVEVVDLRRVAPTFRHRVLEEGIQWSA